MSEKNSYLLFRRIVNLLGRYKFLAVIFYFFLCCFIDLLSISSTLTPTKPIEIHIKSTDKFNLTHIGAYRVALGDKIQPFSEYTLVDSLEISLSMGLSQKYYYTGIILKIANSQRRSLKDISVNIGTKSFRFDRKSFIDKWRVKNRLGDYCYYEAPATVSLIRSKIPVLSSIINWDSDWLLIQSLFADNSLLVLILLLISWKGKYWSAEWSTEGSLIRYVATSSKWRGLVLIICITIYHLPFHLAPIDGSLDASWQLGLNWATMKGLVWGKDIVFTFGPFHWLAYPMLNLDQPRLFLSFIINVFLFFLSLTIIFSRIKQQLYSKGLSTLHALIIILLLILIPYDIFDIVVGVSLLLLINNSARQYILNIVIASVLLALLSLIKFSYWPASISLLAIFTIICYKNGKFASIGICWLSFFSSSCVFWIVSGQKITNYSNYLYTSFLLAKGYTEAMALPIWNSTSTLRVNMVSLLYLTIGMLILCFIGILLWFSRGISKLSTAIILSSPFVFLALKEGLVRSDYSHLNRFVAQILILCIVYWLLFTKAQNKYQYYLLHYSIVISVLLGVLISPLYRPSFSPQFVGIFNESYRLRMLNEVKNSLKHKYNLNPNIINHIRQAESVDIIPNNISLLYAYDANWQPRPVIQSYSAYASALDSIDARFITSSKAPQLILASYESIDNRHMLYDEPLFVRKIMKNYRLMGDINASPLLLSRRHSLLLPIESTEIISAVDLKLNNKQNLTCGDFGNTYMSVDLQLTLIGRIMNFFFKIPIPQLTLEKKGKKETYRFIRENAIHGIILEPFITSKETFADALNGTNIDGNHIISVQINGNQLFYESLIHCKLISEKKE